MLTEIPGGPIHYHINNENPTVTIYYKFEKCDDFEWEVYVRG